ncbi:branched-chain amino acid ABC transporter permease [Actinoplanes sp. NPDC000266]
MSYKTPQTAEAPVSGSRTVLGLHPAVVGGWARLRLPTLVVAAGLAVAWPALAGPYPVTVASVALVFAVLAASTQLLSGIAGLASMGQAGYFGIGAYTAALLGTAGHTLALGQLAAATAVAAVAGAATAPLVLRTRGTPFLMATLALQALTVTAASQWRTLTGGDEGMRTPPVILWPDGPALTGPAATYWYLSAVTGLLTVAMLVLMRTRLILIVRGIAGHEPRMTALGHRVAGRLTAVYTIAAGLAGAGGALLVALNQYVAPADFGFEIASLALLAAAMGGTSLTGAALGALLIIAVRDGLGVGTAGHGPLLLGLLFIAVAYRRPTHAMLIRTFARRRL